MTMAHNFTTSVTLVSLGFSHKQLTSHTTLLRRRRCASASPSSQYRREETSHSTVGLYGHLMTSRPSPSKQRVLGACTTLAWVMCGLLVCATNEAQAANGHSDCSMYTTCTECACRRQEYNVRYTCTAGCAWVAQDRLCIDAAEAEARGLSDSAVTHLFPAPLTGHTGQSNAPSLSPLRQTLAWRRAQIDAGNVACPLPVVNGVVPTVVSCVGLGVWALVLVAVAWNKERLTPKNKRLRDDSWLWQLLRNHTPSADTVEWEAIAKPSSHRSSCNYGILATLAAGLLIAPTCVWLAIGFPVIIDWSATMSFVISMAVTGGLGLLVWVLAAVRACDAQTPTISAFALTNRRLVLVTADPRIHALGSRGMVATHRIGRVTTVVMTPDRVTFTSTAKLEPRPPTISEDGTPVPCLPLEIVGGVCGCPSGLTNVWLPGLAPVDAQRLVDILNQRVTAEADRADHVIGSDLDAVPAMTAAGVLVKAEAAPDHNQHRAPAVANDSGADAGVPVDVALAPRCPSSQCWCLS